MVIVRSPQNVRGCLKDGRKRIEEYADPDHIFTRVYGINCEEWNK